MKNVLRVLTILIAMSCTPDSDPVSTSRVEELLGKMTIAEKVGQMNLYNGFWDATGPVPEGGDAKRKYEQIKSGQVGAMLNILSVEQTRRIQQMAVDSTRLGIPMLFGYDVIHGYKTMFPIPLGETASWDLEAMELSARIAAKETAAAGVHWTYSPMIDVTRDARWGRIMEGSGEDPYLTARVAEAKVRGYQGDDLSHSETIAACLKHFAGYGYAEGGRDYNTADIGTITLHNMILPPFRAGVEAGAASVMNSFNELNGIPATSDKYLQRTLLKGLWGFKGIVVSDWGSVGEIINHGQAGDLRQAAKLSVQGGSDMDMESTAYINHLVNLVENGEVDEKLIDDAVRRILQLKEDLGLFDDPYKYCDEAREQQIYSRENRDIARDIARKSIVLLKNDGVLPLSKSQQNIAVIGPLADDKDSPIGSWRAQGIAGSAVSVLEGLGAVTDDITFAKGCELVQGETSFAFHVKINQDDTSGFQEAVALAKRSEVVILVVGEHGFQTGEGRSRVDIGLPGVQQKLVEALYTVNKNIILVLMNGRPLTLPWADEHIPAIVETWHLGSESGHAIADVIFGDYNPSAKLPVSFPRHVGQLPLSYNHKNTGRPSEPAPDLVFWSHYTDESNLPLYPFGYGLSYTTFEYSTPTLSAASMPVDGSVTVSVEVRNTGSSFGEEVVQLYIRDMVSSVTRPVKELKGFNKIAIEAGASKQVQFQIDRSKLEYYYGDDWRVEPGEFAIMLGSSSVDVQSVVLTVD